MSKTNFLKTCIGGSVSTAKDLLLWYALLRALKFVRAVKYHLEAYDKMPIEKIQDPGIRKNLLAAKKRIQKIFDEEHHLLIKLYSAFDLSALEQTLIKFIAAKLSKFIRFIVLRVTIKNQLTRRYPLTDILFNDILPNFILPEFIHVPIRLVLGAGQIKITCALYNLAVKKIAPNLASMLPVPWITNTLSELPTANCLPTLIDDLYNCMIHTHAKPIPTSANKSLDRAMNIINIMYDAYYSVYDYACKEYYARLSVIDTLFSLASAVQLICKMAPIDIAKQIVNTFYTTGCDGAMDFVLKILMPFNFFALVSFINMQAGFKVWETNLMYFEVKNLNVAKYLGIFSMAMVIAMKIYQRATMPAKLVWPAVAPQGAESANPQNFINKQSIVEKFKVQATLLQQLCAIFGSEDEAINKRVKPILNQYLDRTRFVWMRLMDTNEASSLEASYQVVQNLSI